MTDVGLPNMPYVIVRESYINNSCLVDGLPQNEIRLITEKAGSKLTLSDRERQRETERDRERQRETFSVF